MRTIRRKDMANSDGLGEGCTEVSGKKESKMGLGFTREMGLIRRESGKMGTEFVGSQKKKRRP